MMPHLCMSCEYSERAGEARHCFGEVDYCECPCREHKFGPDDIRMKLIELFTAQAHDEFDLLKSLIGELDADEAKTLLLLNVQFNNWMMKQAGIDPVQHVREAALYWQGGEPPTEDEEESP